MKKGTDKVLSNLAVPVLLLSAFFFGVVGNIVSGYNGSYFRVMFSSFSNFIITAIPVIGVILSTGYLFYAVNKK